jgi:hypothetical protein
MYPNKRILFQSPVAICKSSPQPLKLQQETLSTTSTSLNETEALVDLDKKTEACTNAIGKNDLKINDTPAATTHNLETSCEEMIDDEDFVDSSDEEDQAGEEVEGEEEEEEEVEEGESSAEIKAICNQKIVLPAIEEMEHKSLLSEASLKKSASSRFKTRLMKGVSLGNLKFPFHSSSSSTTPKSPKMKKSKSSSILIDIEKEDGIRKMMFTNSTTESFNSSHESDMFFSMDHTKESWHVVDVSNINYFLNQTGMQEHTGVRNSMSPITKSTQRMPKSMQVSDSL